MSGSYDGTARVWDVESGKTVLAVETGYKIVISVIYSPDTKKIATGGCHEAEIKIWDANTGELLSTVEQGAWSFAWRDQKKLI